MTPFIILLTTIFTFVILNYFDKKDSNEKVEKVDFKNSSTGEESYNDDSYHYHEDETIPTALNDDIDDLKDLYRI